MDFTMNDVNKLNVSRIRHTSMEWILLVITSGGSFYLVAMPDHSTDLRYLIRIRTNG